jgi:3-phenylpropionate/trans-cinnamate dioxygenase ferredoxin reductase component
MPYYPYLIIGGGMTADAAVRGIRELDQSGEIAVISASPEPPYDRPPLSKKLWTGKPLDEIWRHTEQAGVTLHLGRTVQRLEPASHEAVDDRGTVYAYTKALLATGATPRRIAGADGRVIYFRTLQDYLNLRELSATRERFAVIGGGFIGAELAAALALNDRRVTLVFPDPAIGAGRFPPELGAALVAGYRQRGVEVIPGHAVEAVEPRGAELAVRTRARGNGSGQTLIVDGVVAGLGVVPNVGLAQAAGLTVEDGVVVDETLRTSHPDVYAAGDVASFHSPALRRRLRVEHEDNALTQGRAAGRAMAGTPEPYHHLPFFYSDLFDQGYEAVGLLDPRAEMVSDWRQPLREGVVYYLQGERVVGVLLWNVWERLDAARRVVTGPGPYRKQDLIGRI